MNSIFTTSVLDEVVISEINNLELKCEWKNCSNKAVDWLICPMCSSRELQCAEHTKAVRNAPIGETVIFNQTCQHHVLQRSCGIEPI